MSTTVAHPSPTAQAQAIADLTGYEDAATLRWQQACVQAAKLVCRFGALPSCQKEPRDLFRRSLAEADCGWRINTIREAGTSQHGRRQCDQFGTGKNKPVEEIDVYAVLE